MRSVLEEGSSAAPLKTPQEGYDTVALNYDSWRWYHFWNAQEAPHVIRWLEGLRPGIGLDAGAGIGTYSSTYARLFSASVALDLSYGMLTVNQARSKSAIQARRIHLVQGDLMELPFEERAFDWLLCCRVLSHVPRLDLALTEIARVLRPGCECYITDVHPDHPYSRVTVRIPGHAAVSIETHKHSIAALEAASVGAGLRVKSLREFRLSDLTSPPSRNEFSKLYENPRRPIFYTCQLHVS